MLDLVHFSSNMVYVPVMETQRIIFFQEVTKRGGIVLIHQSQCSFMNMIDLIVHDQSVKETVKNEEDTISSIL